MIVTIGSGAWATTIAHLVAENDLDSTMLVHRQEYVDSINQNHTNPIKCGSGLLNPKLFATMDPSVLETASAVIIGLPSVYIHSLDQLNVRHLQNKPVLLLTKGLKRDYKDSFFISDYLISELNLSQLAVLSGPNLAAEILAKKPAATVVASDHDPTSAFFQKILNGPYFRVYRSSDRRGVEFGGIVKNTFAIAAGCMDALNLGSNATASFLCRALVEMQRIGRAFDLDEHTLYGLSGLGDLVATCMSPLSRNRSVGYNLAQADSDTNTPLSGYAEGPFTTQLLAQLAIDKQLNTPILLLISRLLNSEISVQDGISELMSRTLKQEFD